MSENTKNLKEIGLKATYPRLKILTLFQQSSERHLAAEDVYRLLVAEGLDIGLATVYRVLTQFEQAGLLTRHHFEGGRAVFELQEGASHHDHILCIQCGRVEEFFDPKTKQIIQRDRFKGKTIANLFFENSTRTRSTFELAGKRLSANI